VYWQYKSLRIENSLNSGLLKNKNFGNDGTVLLILFHTLVNILSKCKGFKNFFLIITMHLFNIYAYICSAKEYYYYEPLNRKPNQKLLKVWPQDWCYTMIQCIVNVHQVVGLKNFKNDTSGYIHITYTQVCLCSCRDIQRFNTLYIMYVLFIFNHS